MYIQYVGFDVIAGSRVYAFHVIDLPAEAREFTVKVRSEAFRPARLKLQDGPGVCFARLERALQGETPGARTDAHLSIEEGDIQDFLERHPLPKPHAKRAES